MSAPNIKKSEPLSPKRKTTVNPKQQVAASFRHKASQAERRREIWNCFTAFGRKRCGQPRAQQTCQGISINLGSLGGSFKGDIGVSKGLREAVFWGYIGEPSFLEGPSLQVVRRLLLVCFQAHRKTSSLPTSSTDRQSPRHALVHTNMWVLWGILRR